MNNDEHFCKLYYESLVLDCENVDLAYESIAKITGVQKPELESLLKDCLNKYNTDSEVENTWDEFEEYLLDTFKKEFQIDPIHADYICSFHFTRLLNPSLILKEGLKHSKNTKDELFDLLDLIIINKVEGWEDLKNEAWDNCVGPRVNSCKEGNVHGFILFDFGRLHRKHYYEYTERCEDMFKYLSNKGVDLNYELFKNITTPCAVKYLAEFNEYRFSNVLHYLADCTVLDEEEVTDSNTIDDHENVCPELIVKIINLQKQIK